MVGLTRVKNYYNRYLDRCKVRIHVVAVVVAVVVGSGVNVAVVVVAFVGVGAADTVVFRHVGFGLGVGVSDAAARAVRCASPHDMVQVIVERIARTAHMGRNSAAVPNFTKALIRPLHAYTCDKEH